MDDQFRVKEERDAAGAPLHHSGVHLGASSPRPKRAAAATCFGDARRARHDEAGSDDDNSDDDNDYANEVEDDDDDDEDPPLPRRGAAHSPAGSPLPMPHNGSPPGAAEAGDEAVVHVDSPMWMDLFRDLGEKPVPRHRCWGCRRGALNVKALPYEAYTKLTLELPTKVIEHGLFSAAVWAAEYYREEVLGNIVADQAVLDQSHWSGVSILWHFFKHTHIAQFRILGETLELEYASDMMMTKRLYIKPQFGGEPTVDPVTAKALAPIRSMLDRQRKIDPKKTVTYHHGLGSSGKAAAPFAKDRFTGRGLLHK